jgi:dihydrofolate reductase
VAKVKCTMVMSPNGYIARLDGDESWISSINWTDFLADAKACNNFIIGRDTYDFVSQRFDTNNFDTVEAEYKVIVSGKGDLQAPDEYSVVKSPQEAVEFLSDKGMDLILLSGGSRLNTSFAEAGLIDILELIVEPHVIGAGKQVLAPGQYEFDLKLLELNKFSENRAQLLYEVVKSN